MPPDRFLRSGKNGSLVKAMNARLKAPVDKEVGEDVGPMLPGGVDGGWVVTGAGNDVWSPRASGVPGLR